MEIRRDVFQAIADPTRRQIISMVAKQPLNLNSIAEQFDVTRQAVSLHVKILSECGLIMIKQQGRERYCEAKLDKLNEVAVWVEQYKQFWEQKFDALETYLDKIQKQKIKKMPGSKSTADREIRISRVLNAPIKLVWEVWTDPEHIKNWWGPNGFTNTISKMEVKENGEWDLVMHGPDGIDYKNKSIFKEVVKHKKLVYEHISAPKFIATISFEEQEEKTLLNWHMLFESKEQFIQVVKTFKADEGLKQNVDKLHEYLVVQKQIHNQLKPNRMARVTTYLNFDGKTEEAFHYYKNIFKGEFTGHKLQRFEDIELPEGHPPMSDADLKLIIHAELTIMGGHILMATDAPESMGFKLTSGNKMHINLEPESKEETRRLFEALSEGGEITMALQDLTFFGSYYGSCTDKYGINWMFNYIIV